ncbi:hypothetical protein ACFV0T_04400 [Streptomyces sp. NPDC059582]|uniref:hypothetical protein n=1 Tax=Streptomyces sp. NPDC059582 TaxID=3346875 RepID=UPI003677289C
MVRVAEMIRENVVQTYIRSLLTVCALSGALLVAGGGEGGGRWPTWTTAPRPITADTTADTTAVKNAGAPDGSGSRAESLSGVIGPLMVPELPDLPVGGGLIPGGPDESGAAAPVAVEGGEVTGTARSGEVTGAAELDGSGAAASIFDSPIAFFAD